MDFAHSPRTVELLERLTAFHERVVRGLGHGLDQAAIDTAQAMQFHPVMQSGAPIATKATIHVSFQLAQ